MIHRLYPCIFFDMIMNSQCLNCRKAEEVLRQLPGNTQVFKVPATKKKKKHSDTSSGLE
jgi:hypothetical protein